MRKLLVVSALVGLFLSPMVNPVEAYGYCPPPIHHAAASPGVFGGPTSLIKIVADVGYGGVMAFTFFAPAIVQQDNPLCDLFTCYDDQGRAFVTDASGTHPQG